MTTTEKSQLLKNYAQRASFRNQEIQESHEKEPIGLQKLSKRQHNLSGLVVTLFLLSWSLLHFGPTLFGLENERIGDIENNSLLFDFADIIPNEKLQWHSCYQTYKCARLTVAMDYHRPLNASSSNPKVHIALVMIPGVHKGSQNFSSSPLLINPGGPGGSGVNAALRFGDQILKVVGADQDVIGFDPRGVGSTTPKANCFASFSEDGGWDYLGGAFHRLVWTAAAKEVGLVNSSSDSLQKLDTRARAVAKLCQYNDFLLGQESIFKYASTPNVARDMLSIVDAWEEWTNTLEKDPSNSSNQPAEEQDRVGTDGSSPDLDTKGKLVYWGFSYGTLLGATFASMFSDRVGRVVLDGVVDANHYVSPIWVESIIDADAVFNSFFEYCHKAAAECKLYRPGDTVADIEERFQTVMASIQKQPLITINPLQNIPVTFTISDIRAALFVALYSPVQMFPIIGALFDLFYRGLDQPVAFLDPQYDLQPLCGPPPPASTFPSEAQLAIMCLDKRYALNETIPNLQLRFEEMSNLSSWADVWMGVMIGCDTWGIEAVDPPMRWDDHPAHKQKPIKTSFPVLFVSNTADPVTPLKAGVRMARKFVDSGFIEQKSEGHCSLAAVSRCTISKIKAYLTEGKVPPHPIKGGKGRELVDGKWDKCEANEWPFHPFGGDAYIAANGEEAGADVEAMVAFQKMQEAFESQEFWGRSSSLHLTSELRRFL